MPSSILRWPFISMALTAPAGETLYAQAVEERNRRDDAGAVSTDRDVRVEISGVTGAQSVRHPAGCAGVGAGSGASGHRTGQQAGGRGRDEGDTGEQFIQWFLNEQAEEMALMTSLVRVADRAGANCST
jgi:hypothetical protein